MKLRNLFLGVCSAVAVFAACQPQEENLGTPDISIDKTEMVFDIEGGSQTLTVTATVNWHVESDVDWVDVSPESGPASADPQTVTVTVLENTGMTRPAHLKFTIGMKSKYLTISQTGPGGSPEALIVYFNDFDKEEATKTYGSSGDKYPYLDQFDGWMNATGTGSANVEYTYNGMSTRSNSTSDSNYSDYAGSGKNNMFFGASAYLATKNIVLNGAKDFTLTFGTEKYSQDNGSVFQNSEFHIYLSIDGTKWVEHTDYTFAGGTTEGRWNIASTSFSVPEGTEALSICMQVDIASSYRMDDMKLVISEGGEVVDFSAATEKDFGKPTNGGQGSDSDATAIYSNNYDKEAAVKDGDYWPYLDKSDVWKNAAGTGAANVTYNSKNVTVRNNSNSNGGYSDYAGSGLNNIFFGKDYPYFSTNNIALNGATSLELTFGTEKYSQTLGGTFTNSEFHIWLSADGTKWVELTDYTFAGKVDGKWNLATANFTVPAGTENLSICMQVDAESAYRLDDFKLVASTTAGTAIDFTQGVEKDFSEGGSTGGDQPGGSDSDATAIYSNNYDKSDAVKDGNYWPYLDQFEGWKNAAGTGVANVTYNSKNVTVRNNSNSDGDHSDYAGSGHNNIFFGKEYPYFSTNNIALNGATTLELTFGTEKYSQTLGSTFTNSEFHIWLSADGTKWVELTDYTFAGKVDGKWNVATANFTVPAGTENLSICMQVDVESSYRLDDFKLVESTTAGTAIDFTQGVEKDFNAGATGGGNEGGETPTPPTPPAGGSSMTIAEVLASSGALASGSTIEGVVISNMDLNNLTSKKGMYIQDETAALQFYLAANHEFAFGDKVQIDLSGVTLGAYNGAVQVNGLALGKITKISSGNTVTPKTVTMADFLANKYEGQYIALEGVQVASADLSKTFVMGGAHTSISMEDANGNKFVVFSSKHATYGTTAVPQGSGTIKGISSINNGTMQIIFAQNSDYAGLTGERFGGTEVTPPAGGGEDDDDEPVTPPTGEATVAKLAMNTLGLANAENVDGREIKVDDNITIVFKKASSGTAPAYYDASQGIRMYQNGATLDVKATSGRTITSIKFTFDYKQWYMAPDSGEFTAEGDVRTWTGAANAVKFTSTGTDKNHRAYVKEIEVTYY